MLGGEFTEAKQACGDWGCFLGIFTIQVCVVCLVESILTSEYHHSHTMHYLCHTSGSIGDIWQQIINIL